MILRTAWHALWGWIERWRRLCSPTPLEELEMHCIRSHSAGDASTTPSSTSPRSGGGTGGSPDIRIVALSEIPLAVRVAVLLPWPGVWQNGRWGKN